MNHGVLSMFDDNAYEADNPHTLYTTKTRILRSTITSFTAEAINGFWLLSVYYEDVQRNRGIRTIYTANFKYFNIVQITTMLQRR